MIKQDNRSPLSNETDEKIRRLKELLDAPDGQENTDTEQTNAAQSVTVNGNGNVVSTGNSKVVLIKTHEKSDIFKTCLLCFLFFSAPFHLKI